MTQETNVALLVEQARMFVTVRCSVLHSLADIAFCDDYSIDCHTNVVTIRINLFGVPFASRLPIVAWWDSSRPMGQCPGMA